jgi:hypothetical protein
MLALRDLNEGFSVHTPRQPFYDLEELNPLLSATFGTTQFANTPITASESLHPSAEQATSVISRLAERYDNAWMILGGEMQAHEATGGGGGGGGAPSPGPNVAESILTSMTKALRDSNVSPETKAQQEIAERAAFALCIAFSSPGDDGELKPLVLSTEGKDFFASVVSKDFVPKLTYSYKQAILELRMREEWFNRAITMTEEHLSTALVTALHSGRWMTTNLNSAAHRLPHLLNLVTFASPLDRNNEFAKRANAEATALLEEAAGMPETLRTQRATELPTQGATHSIEAFKESIANLRAVVYPLVVDFDSSLLWNNLKAIEKAWSDPKGRALLKAASDSEPRRFGSRVVIHNVFNFAQAVVGEFMNLAANPLYLRALKNLEPIGNQALEPAKVQFNGVMASMMMSINQGNYLMMYVQPAWSTTLYGPFGAAGTGGAKRARDDEPPKGTPPERKKTPPTPPARPSTDLRASKGFLVYSGPPSSQPPNVPPVLVDRNGTKKQLCMRFACQGAICKTGTNCTDAHISSYDSLPPDSQKQLLHYVNTVSVVDWPQGKKPAGNA